MSLILATGSNLGDSKKNLFKARRKLQEKFKLIEASPIYSSKAVDYKDQPSFFNQVLEFKLPNISPQEVLRICLEIETKMGRIRNIDKGPRIIDIDIIFFGIRFLNTQGLTIPHPAWRNRSFVVRPLAHLPFSQKIKPEFFQQSFETDAFICP